MLLLGVAVQYCEEYRFGYHVLDCPDATEGVYDYAGARYFLLSNGTLARRTDDGYTSTAEDVESVHFYDNSLILLMYNRSLFKYSGDSLTRFEFRCQTLAGTEVVCNGVPF